MSYAIAYVMCFVTYISIHQICSSSRHSLLASQLCHVNIVKSKTHTFSRITFASIAFTVTSKYILGHRHITILWIVDHPCYEEFLSVIQCFLQKQHLTFIINIHSHHTHEPITQTHDSCHVYYQHMPLQNMYPHIIISHKHST